MENRMRGAVPLWWVLVSLLSVACVIVGFAVAVFLAFHFPL